MGTVGGRWVIRSTFRTEEFWTDITTFGCTTTQLIPAMVAWLLDNSTEQDSAGSTLRNVVTAPLTERTAEFQKRFGVRVRTVYGMTEIGMAISRFPDVSGDMRHSGRVTAGYEVRLVDEYDYEVTRGEVGELIVRTAVPWSLNSGYFSMPEETARAWRNGWFHTGDGLRQNDDGTFVFVDRLKDSLRRRGENVSSFELERVVLDHPDIAECAVIGLGEADDQEIKVVAVVRPDTAITPAALIEHLRAEVAPFMVPRYVEFVDALPRTDVTDRVKKSLLREAGVTEATWDRLAS
jgi:crotonobetaine/carnitine-CoA ligase